MDFTRTVGLVFELDAHIKLESRTIVVEVVRRGNVYYGRLG